MKKVDKGGDKRVIKANKPGKGGKKGCKNLKKGDFGKKNLDIN